MYMKSTKFLDIFYWAVIVAFAFSLFVEMYALAAFFALLIVVIQLNQISTYLVNILLHLKDRQENIESKK
jgi:hypothetical protein